MRSLVPSSSCIGFCDPNREETREVGREVRREVKEEEELHLSSLSNNTGERNTRANKPTARGNTNEINISIGKQRTKHTQKKMKEENQEPQHMHEHNHLWSMICA